jgi:PAS domain S-box-containing protein
LTPFSFTVTGLAFAWGLYRFHLLDLVPVAREAIIESMSDAILVLDLQNRIVDLNPAAQRLIGRTSQEAIGQQGTDVFPEAPKLVERYRDALQVHTSIALGKDESLRHYDLSISPVYAHGGQLNGRLAVLRDITERKRAEDELKQHREHLQELVDERTAALEKVNARLQEDIAERKRVEEALREGERFLASIFTSIQDGLSVLDKDLNIVRVNPQMEVWYSHNLPLVGRKCYEAYHDRNERCEICPSHRAIETGEATWDVAPKRGPGGEMVGWYELYSFPFVDVTSGQMKGVIEYVRDITDRRRMEEERARLVEELQEALTKIKTLRGLIPICASCKKIRNDQGYWEQIEVYVRDHSEAEFSHGICPDCARKLYPDFFTEGEDLR